MNLGAEQSFASGLQNGTLQASAVDAVIAPEVEAYCEEMQAGGPGSGRHKSGLTTSQKTNVVALRKQGFRSSALHSIDGTHAMIRTDDTGRTHVFNFDHSGGWTHSVTTNKAGTSFRTKSAGNKKTLGQYAGNSKNIGRSSAFTNAQMSRSTKSASAFHAHRAEHLAGTSPKTAALHTRASNAFKKASASYALGKTDAGNAHYARGMEHVDQLGGNTWKGPRKPKVNNVAVMPSRTSRKMAASA